MADPSPPSAPPSFARRILRRVLLIFLAVFLLAVAVQAVRIHLARTRFHAILDKIRQSGGPVYVEDITPTPISDALNRATLWRKARDDYQPEAFSHGEDLPQSAELVPPLADADIKRVREFLDANASTLADIDAALAAPGPCQWDVGLHGYVPYQARDLKVQTTIDGLMLASAKWKHATGDDAGAFDMLNKDEQLVDDLRLYPGFYGYTGATGCDTRVCTAALQIAADWNRLAKAGTPAKLPREQMDALTKNLLDDDKRQTSLQRAALEARVLDVDFSMSMLGMGLTKDGHGPRVKAAPAVRPFILPNFLDGQTQSLQYSTDCLPIISDPSWNSSQTRLRQLKHPTAGIFVSGGRQWEVMIRLKFENTANRRLAATSLAISKYTADHKGEFPKTLNELVPTYLPAVAIIDPFTDGQSFRYKLEPKPILYSVGTNGIDDNGETATGDRFQHQPPLDIPVDLLPPPPPKPVEQ